MIKNISILAIVSLFVGTYQISLIENKLNDYGVENNVSSYFPEIISFQNNIENIKLSFKAGFMEEKTIEVAIKEELLPKPQEDSQVKDTSEHVLTEKQDEEDNVQKDNLQPTEEQNIIAKNTITEEHSTIQSNDGAIIQTSNDTSSIIINKKCIKNCVVLMVGDSVMGDVFYSLNRKIKKEHPDFTVIDGHKVSSGLSNTTYYDWPTIAEQLTKKYSPNYTFVLLGMNDAQGIFSNHKGHSFGSISWIEIYKERTHNLKEIITKNSDNMFWIELPQVRENKFNSRLSIIRNIHKEENLANFIETSSLLGNNTDPNFSRYRQSDGIHLSAPGSDKITEKIMNIFKS